MPGDGSNGAPADAATIDAMPDADCSCGVAPAPRCIDAMTLESSRAPGTCTAGSCTFDTFRSTCPFGCAGGACQPAACTPTCPAQVCADDGCGGSCGPCPTDTTFPGVTPVPLGIARDLRAAPDGTHVVTMRALDPRCGTLPLDMGRLDVWTVPASGAPSHRTIGAHAPLFATRFTDDGYLVYNDRADLCAFLGDLWVARADGRDPIQLATGTFLGPTVAGHWVYYTAPDPDDPPPMPGQLLYAARLPDGAPQLVTHLPSGSSDTVSPTGDAVWVTRTTPEPDLILFRVDGSFTPLVATPIEVAGTPLWAPDGKRLAYAQFDRRIGKTSLHVIDTAGGQPSLLTDDCGCGALDSIAFAPDGSRIAWLVAPGFGAPVDAMIHRFAGGPDVQLTGVVSPSSGGEVFRLAFSADGSRLYAASGDISTGWQLMSGRVDTPGPAVSLGSLRSDGDRFATSWDETRDGTVLAFNGSDSATHVIGPGGMQSIAGIPLERPRFEPTLTNPRLLVQQDLALSLFPTSGAGPGIRLPGFDWTDQLSAWVFSGEVPFAFGWSGPVALYPSAVQGSSLFAVVQDLMAWTPSAQGRLSSRVIRYRVVDDPARIYLITQDQALTMVPRPSIAPGG
jgi:WD40-like Beta Propeller Repeat